MDTQTLTESLRGFDPAGYEWQFALYSTHKSRDGIELEFHLCDMRDIPSLIRSLIETILTKTLSDRIVEQYSPLLPKESIGALEQSGDLIREQIGDVLSNIRYGVAHAPEDFITGAAAKPVGYGFYGCTKDECGKITDEVLFLRRSNPFMTGKNARLCTTAADTVIKTENPVLKFTHATDFLLLGGVCYFFSAGIEKDFSLVNRHIALCAKRMQTIAQAAAVNNFEQLEAVAMAAKNARKFPDFDVKILEHIQRLSIPDRIDFLSTYGITVDHQGRMETYDSEQCELVVDLLCCRSCLDPLGRLSTGKNITPRL